MIINWLFLQLDDEEEHYIIQQDEAPPHWHLSVHKFLNDKLLFPWIDHKGADDQALHHWPPTHPDLTPCDFFLWK